VDRPKPWNATSSWVAGFAISVWVAVTIDHVTLMAAIPLVFAYSVLGCAFALAGLYLASRLFTPPGQTLPGDRGIRRLKRGIMGVFLAALTALAFTLHEIPLMNAAHNERDYAIFLSYWSFLMILQAFGMPWSELGAKPARPDVPAHAL